MTRRTVDIALDPNGMNAYADNLRIMARLVAMDRGLMRKTDSGCYALLLGTPIRRNAYLAIKDECRDEALRYTWAHLFMWAHDNRCRITSYRLLPRAMKLRIVFYNAKQAALFKLFNDHTGSTSHWLAHELRSLPRAA